MEALKKIKWYVKADIQLMTEKCWYGKEEKIDSFYFYSKQPFSKAYQYHAPIGLQDTYRVLTLLQFAIKKKSKVVRIGVRGRMGKETLSIHKEVLRKAESDMLEMIENIQKQY